MTYDISDDEPLATSLSATISQVAENVPNPFKHTVQLTKPTNPMALYKHGGPSEGTSKPVGITEFEILKASHK